MTPLDTSQLVSLVELKVALLERIFELGQRQLDLIGESDYGQLLKLLGIKQRILGGLQDIEQRMLPFRNQDPASRVWNSAVERQNCERMLQRCEELLAMILTQEQQSEKRVIVHREHTAQQLQGLHHVAEIQGAYGQQEWETNMMPGQLDLLSGS